ncbi:IucA/IucC family siderophore biosynthesis protein [Frankia sp. QA3]|uniref:IucA/IucC family protein n=1 Tax=Frankia sp. QA3 TaxID=710111 RepID=UPI000269CBAA|nr:IucA/IucC family protein [Frankia sp. QA3]EIV95475.1 siderophore synthetase component [Frankia sp. QA3]
MTGGQPTAAAVADDIVTETLLRCWLRETGALPDADARAIDVGLPASGLSIRAMVTHRSPSGWHRFAQPELVPPAGTPSPVDAGLLAALLVREIAAEQGLPAAHGAEALGRIIDSARRIAAHLDARRTGGHPSAVPPFLAAEQASLTGHPFHPAAASRQGASDRAMAAYSPERAGFFALHWFAAHPSVVSTSGVPAAERSSATRPPGGSHHRVTHLLAELYGGDDASGAVGGHRPIGADPSAPTGTDRGGLRDAHRHATSFGGPAGPGEFGGNALPPGYVPVPAHPWQARELIEGADSPLAQLLADGRLIDLGRSGSPWYPTSSLRTVWRPDSRVMLKLSLGLRITNSRRVLHLGELRLAEMITRLVDAGLGAALTARHPNFHLIGEPDWVAVTRSDRRPPPSGESERRGIAQLAGTSDDGDGTVGLETAIRTNPFGLTDRAVSMAALVAPRPDRAGDSRGRSRAAMLPRLLTRLADRRHEPVRALAETWFGSYLTVLAAPVLDLYLQFGVGVEAHLQNTLVTLDADGWPVIGWYRDSQGYYVAASAAAAMERLLPGFATGLDAIFDDELVAERIIYYLFVNNVFAVAGALGAAGVADEHRLLGRARDLLARMASDARSDHGPAGPPAVRRRLLATLLTAPTLPSKGNLRTCVDGRDELIGPVATQSVYVQIPNPLLEAAP